jgi:hypothetical protein
VYTCVSPLRTLTAFGYLDIVYPCVSTSKYPKVVLKGETQVYQISKYPKAVLKGETQVYTISKYPKAVLEEKHKGTRHLNIQKPFLKGKLLDI